MASNLEEAIELSKDCCEKKKLLVYGISYGSSYYGEPDKTSFVCANCRTHYYWSSDEQVARKSESKMSDEGIYQAVELYIGFWRNVKDHSSDYIESFTKSLNLDKSRIEKVIRKSELYSEYGYQIEDEKDLETEGVTIAFSVYSNEPLTSSLNSIEKIENAISKLTQPYKILTEDYSKVEVENRVFWEPFCSGSIVFAASISGTFAISMKGPVCEIKRALEYLVNSYGLPCAIYKPNSLFEKDTDKGVEVAKEICLKKGGKIKKPSLLESKLFYKNEKYIVFGKTKSKER